MIKFTNKLNLDRNQLAQKLADLIDDGFEAYEATLGDNYHFVIDRNNNWRANFSREDNTFQISYRYGEQHQPEQIAIFNKEFN